jgi:hypothetical protein
VQKTGRTGRFPFAVALAAALLLICSSFTQAAAAPKNDDALWAVLVRGASHQDDPELKKISGTKISLVGWIIPNEYDQGELVSFLLARYPGGCVHVPLPPPENVVHVTMAEKAKKLKNVSLTKKVVVEGMLTSVGRVDASYEFEASSVHEAD